MPQGQKSLVPPGGLEVGQRYPSIASEEGDEENEFNLVAAEVAEEMVDPVVRVDEGVVPRGAGGTVVYNSSLGITSVTQQMQSGVMQDPSALVATQPFSGGGMALNPMQQQQQQPQQQPPPPPPIPAQPMQQQQQPSASLAPPLPPLPSQQQQQQQQLPPTISSNQAIAATYSGGGDHPQQQPIHPILGSGPATAAAAPPPPPPQQQAVPGGAIMWSSAQPEL